MAFTVKFFGFFSLKFYGVRIIVKIFRFIFFFIFFQTDQILLFVLIFHKDFNASLLILTVIPNWIYRPVKQSNSKDPFKN